MVVKRVEPLSLAKLMGVLYVLVGLCFGAFVSLVAILGGAWMTFEGSGGFGALFGAGAIVVLPIFYGGLGFITSLIGAVIYNWVASFVGGVEIQVQ